MYKNDVFISTVKEIGSLTASLYYISIHGYLIFYHPYNIIK